MRASGFYWVRDDEIWTIAYYGAHWKGWWAHGEDGNFNDSDWAEIDEHRIERSEHKDLHRPAMEIIREKVEAEQQRDELLAGLEDVIMAGTSGSRGMRDFISEAKRVLDKAKAAQAGEDK